MSCTVSDIDAKSNHLTHHDTVSSFDDPSTTHEPGATNDTDELLRADRKHVWHPYSKIPADYDCQLVDSAHGVYLTLRDGTKIVDGMSSWWAAIHGYNVPHLNQAVTSQLASMSHVMFGGLTHAPAIRLAQQLCRISTGHEHVFFCDSGSVAVEVAMKLALQASSSDGGSSRSSGNAKTKFLTVKRGYHGDTFSAMSVCDPVNGMHHLFQSSLQQHLFCDAPEPSFDEEFDERHMDSMKEQLRKHAHEICAIILEPIVQGAGGMRFYSPRYLKRVRELCDEYEVLLICDEIATGFGRTGKVLASQHAGIVPDITCLGKALSGGYMSFAAVTVQAHVARSIDQSNNVLMHGPTFMANPLACAVSLASLELLPSSMVHVPAIERQLKRELAPCRDSPLVKDVRVLGAIGVVELHDPVDMKTFQPALVKEGVWLRPFGRLLYTMPPFVISPAQLRKLTSTMVKLTRRKS